MDKSFVQVNDHALFIGISVLQRSEEVSGGRESVGRAVLWQTCSVGSIGSSGRTDRCTAVGRTLVIVVCPAALPAA